MSRHRITAKMHRVRDQPEEPRPAEVDGGNANPPEAVASDAPAAKPALPQETLTGETLERRLAAEVAAREVSEQRTTDVLARYFKVTLVMVGLNMLVAGASVATLIKFATTTHTVVVTAPPPPAPVPPPAVEKPPAGEKPAPPPAAALAGPGPAAPSSPAKLQLLGGPPLPAGKPAAKPSPARSARAPVMPAPKRLVTFAEKTPEAAAPEPSRLTERW